MAQTRTITIKWDNAVTIENVAQKKTELLKVFNSNQEIFLDISQLDDIDISGVQLIIACKKEAQIRNLNFKVTGDISSNLRNFFQRIGIPIDKLTTTEQLSSEILETIAGDENA